MLELLEEHAMPHQTPVGVFHASPTPVGLMRDNSKLQLDGFVHQICCHATIGPLKSAHRKLAQPSTPS